MILGPTMGIPVVFLQKKATGGLSQIILLTRFWFCERPRCFSEKTTGAPTLHWKHVAFDVYQQVFDNLAQRRRSMRTITLGFISSTVIMTSHLVWQDRRNTLYQPKQILKNAKTLVGLAQMMWRLLPDYLAFYKASFHPSEIDQQDLLSKARELLVV